MTNRVRRRRRPAIGGAIARLHRLVDFPFTALYLLHDRAIHPAYGMTWRRKIRLALRMFRNVRRVETLTSYKAHLAMAVKLLRIPPDEPGVVVECGCYLGGSTANLSLACEIAGRELVVYDSFEGLPRPDPADARGDEYPEGSYRASLEETRENVRRLGDLGRCRFVKGTFDRTLPEHSEPIVLCFVDVDHERSLRDCVLSLWPHLTERGYMFVDEYVYLGYCALFFSEAWWSENFDRDPPGLLGAGSGIGVGEFYLGPWEEQADAPLQRPHSIAYTRKDFSGRWTFEPAGPSP